MNVLTCAIRGPRLTGPLRPRLVPEVPTRRPEQDCGRLRADLALQEIGCCSAPGRAA